MTEHEEKIDEEEKPVREKSLEELDVEKDISHFKAITAIAEQEGGKIIISGLETDVLSAIEAVCDLEKSDLELRIAAIKLRINLSLLRVFVRAPKGAALAEERLKEILAE